MPKTPAMGVDQMVQLREAGKTYAEIAKEAGITVWGVQKAIQRANRTKKQTSHKEWLPWTVKPEHSNASVVEYVRRLSHLTKGKLLHDDPDLSRYQADFVVNWANDLIDEGLDYDYDPDVETNDFCVSGGFFTREADPEDWKIKKLMDRVREVQTRKLS